MMTARLSTSRASTLDPIHSPDFYSLQYPSGVRVCSDVGTVTIPAVSKARPFNDVYRTFADESLNVGSVDGNLYVCDLSSPCAGLGVLANDILPTSVDEVRAGGTAYPVSSASGASDIALSHGTLSVFANGAFRFVPTANSTGTDTFSYRDKNAFSPAGTPLWGDVTINIDQVPAVDETRVRDDVVALDEDTTVTIAASELLANDGNATAAAMLLFDGATTFRTNHGTLSLTASHTSGSEVQFSQVEYTPDANFHGLDTFTYYAVPSDEYFGTVTLDVRSIPDDPLAEDDSASIGYNGVADIDIGANDAIPDGGEGTYECVKPAGTLLGALRCDGEDANFEWFLVDGTLIGGPKNADFVGESSMEYRLTDARGRSDRQW